VTSPLHSSIPTFFGISPTLVSSSTNDDSEDENPTLLTHPPLFEFNENELTPTPQFPTWVHTTQAGIDYLVGDPSY